MLKKVLFALGICSTLIWAQTLKMATTTSTDNTGLLDVLAPQFQNDTGIKLEWVSVGTGNALKLGENCDVSVLLVHSPKVEEEYVKKGFGVDREPVMYNDFVIIGDPFYLETLKGKTLKEVFEFIRANKIPFISRGDKSGTHNKEVAIWKSIGSGVPSKQDQWYKESGQGMLATIQIASENKALTLTDRGTFIKYIANLKGKKGLVIVSEGDDALKNFYSVMAVNPQRCKNTDYQGAMQFIRWITGEKGQSAIKNFKLNGQELFTPNAQNSSHAQ
ncbi:tungstate ABC transporter substrate-binding protein TupA [Helicobacter kayseriensis]|uniref:tungstate ABC transporter substrate-binding protein TupA n=1 Tax=Helicobacter kayseriensis TaxID=2905877 RepID=UPI001E2E0174|nr:tungstate ABC transporter substrate-binding protein TupA [Helicobacter kayseriensis]MCE3047114.1 substrate-binding domain-containing protein [Helicobacter kayseriensis]MCE3048485.1 substrate-binding domain-containing protein [Helicobacter kayseriensis]